MNIFDKILSPIFKPKESFIISDLKKLQINGRIEKINTNCKKKYYETYSSNIETNKFDEIERKFNNEIIFNPFGYKIQEIQYKERSKKTYDIKTFEYNSDSLLKREICFSKSNNLNYISEYKYIFKKKIFKQFVYVGDRLMYENRFYFNNNFKIFLIKKITYLPNTLAESEIHFDENGNIVKKNKNYFNTQTVNEYKDGKKVKSVYSITFNIVTCVVKYKYENNNCIEKYFYKENGELFRSDFFTYDVKNNWTNKIINYHNNCIYDINRKIDYYKT